MRKFSVLLRVSTLAIWFSFLLAGVSAPGASLTHTYPAKPAASQIILPALTDASISEGYPGSACGKVQALGAGYDWASTNRGRVRSLIKFDLTSLPEGAVVSQAVLNLRYSGYAGPTTGEYMVSVVRAASPWAENSVQWNTSPTFPLTDPVTTTVKHSETLRWIQLDVTELVQGWVQEQYPNYGLALFGPEEVSLNSTVEFFESSESENKPSISVTYTQPSMAAANGGDLPSWYAYLPLLMSSFPPLLDLHPIDNDGGEGSYTLTWTPHPQGASFYELFEWTGSAWEVVFTAFSGETAFNVKNKPLGTYSYFLTATGAWGTERSLVRSVTVSDQPNPFVYLVIGVGNYQNMPTLFTPDARLGNDLKYPIFDATDVQDMLEVYGIVEDQPSDRVLALKDRQATKAAIQTAITGWVDARETISTTIFIYYAGHTLLAGDPLKPFLAPYDLACAPCGQSASWQAATGISAQEINAWLGELAAERILFVFDSPESARWIDELSAPGRQILAGSSPSNPGEKRWEFDEIKNGAFSWFLNDVYIQPGITSPVSLQDAYNYTKGVNLFVNQHTLNIPGGPFLQIPAFNADLSFPGDFIREASVEACQGLVK